jgi:predicted dehydrogenase
VCLGAGYFSQFHFHAWQRMERVNIVSVCDVDASKAAGAAQQYGFGRHDVDFTKALDDLRPDFVDVITPPETHLALVEEIAGRGVPIVCQKPLAPSLEEARQLVHAAASAGVRLMVHENFRFQPWHRAIKRLIDAGAIGEVLHSLTFRTRTGDGWGDDAYLGRQPYFRRMPRLLVYETGVHFIDTFRYLAGDVDGAYALLRRLNPVICGEDAGLLIFELASGAVAVWDANRYNESADPDPRFTFGEFLVEGDGGSIRLYPDGRLTVQPLGEPERDHAYPCERRGFGGDCVFATLRHFVECLESGQPFETEGHDYLKTLAVQEAVYQSAREGRPVRGLADPPHERGT